MTFHKNLIYFSALLILAAPILAFERELSLSQKLSGWVYKEPSLLYINIAYTNPADEIVQMKALYSPPVDKFTLMDVPDCMSPFNCLPFFVYKFSFLAYTTYFKNGEATDYEIWISGFNMTTGRKRYFMKNYNGGNYVLGSYSVIVYMNQGNVTSIDWFDGCSECDCSSDDGIVDMFCPDSICLSNACAVTEADCDKMGPQTCNIKVYVGWIGTDANGRPFDSSSSFPQNFMRFGFSKTYRAAAGVDKQYFFKL